MHINCKNITILILSALCLSVSGEEWKMNLSMIDQDGDELISLDEFEVFIMQLPNLREHYQEEEIGELSQAAFQLFDHNKDQSLEKKEYEEMAKHMG